MSLERRTPLRADPEKTRAWQDRSRRKARWARPGLPRGRNPGPTPVERDKVRARSGGACEARTDFCTYRAVHMHHVVTRARGAGWAGLHLADNLLHVCEECHRWVHDNPAAAAAMGLLKRREG